MEKATCHVRTSDTQCIPVANVTPAEAMLLTQIHGSKTSDNVVIVEAVISPTPADASRELSRLRAKYGNDGAKLIEALWPGHIKNFPKTFKEVGIVVKTASTMPRAVAKTVLAEPIEAITVPTEEPEAPAPVEVAVDAMEESEPAPVEIRPAKVGKVAKSKLP